MFYHCVVLQSIVFSVILSTPAFPAGVLESRERTKFFMERFIPENKMSKKARRALHCTRRRDWGVLNPVTKKETSKKIYNRKRIRKERDPYASVFQFSKVFRPIPFSAF